MNVINVIMSKCSECGLENENNRTFLYRNTPECVCRPCYYKAYCVVKRARINENRRARATQLSVVTRLYKLTPEHAAVRERVRDFRRTVLSEENAVLCAIRKEARKNGLFAETPPNTDVAVTPKVLVLI